MTLDRYSLNLPEPSDQIHRNTLEEEKFECQEVCIVDDRLDFNEKIKFNLNNLDDSNEQSSFAQYEIEPCNQSSSHYQSC